MSHVRQQIRDHVATLLTGFIYDRFGIILRDRSGSQLTDNTTVLGTGTIYKYRRYALDDSQLPALLIYTPNEDVQLATMGNRTLGRILELRVDIINKGSSTNIFENIEQFCAEMARAIEEDYDLGGLAKSCILSQTDIAVDTSGERAIGTGKMFFNVTYVTDINNCQVSV